MAVPTLPWLLLLLLVDELPLLPPDELPLPDPLSEPDPELPDPEPDEPLSLLPKSSVPPVALLYLL